MTTVLSLDGYKGLFVGSEGFCETCGALLRVDAASDVLALRMPDAGGPHPYGEVECPNCHNAALLPYRPGTKWSERIV